MKLIGESMSDTAHRTHLITRFCEEVIGRDEIPGLLEQEIPLRHYIGLEISGRLHLGTGLVCMQKVRDLEMAGIHCTIFLADWHTWLNDKLGGDREAIKRIAGGYFKEGLKASLKAVGGDPDDLEFILGSDLYHNNDQYWETLVEVCKNTTLSRVERSISIMGRSEGESVDFAKLLYPPMQVADVFAMHVNFAQGGMDQRKAHVIVRDVANQLKIMPLRDGKRRQCRFRQLRGTQRFLCGGQASSNGPEKRRCPGFDRHFGASAQAVRGRRPQRHVGRSGKVVIDDDSIGYIYCSSPQPLSHASGARGLSGVCITFAI